MCKGLYKAGDSARPCSEGLVPQDDEQVIGPEVPLPEIPRREADRQSVTQVKAALDLLAVSRRHDFDTFSPSSGLSPHRRENQITNLLGLLPRCFCTASTVIDCGQRAGSTRQGSARAASLCLLLAPQLSVSLFPLQLHTSLPFITLRRGDRFPSAFPVARSSPSAEHCLRMPELPAGCANKIIPVVTNVPVFLAHLGETLTRLMSLFPCNLIS